MAMQIERWWSPKVEINAKANFVCHRGYRGFREHRAVHSRGVLRHGYPQPNVARLPFVIATNIFIPNGWVFDNKVVH